MNSTTVLQQSNSVYIPSIIAPTGQIVDVQFITELFQTTWCLGEVNRVDIIDVVNEFGERVGGKRSAFVHMNHWETNNTTSSIIEEINKEGKCILWLSHNSNRGRGCYWTLKKMNREPVQETQLNVHQLAAKVLELEEIIKARDNQINEINSQHTQYICLVHKLTSSLYDEIDKRDNHIECLHNQVGEYQGNINYKYNNVCEYDDHELNTDVDNGQIDELIHPYPMHIDELNTDVDNGQIDELNTDVDNGQIDELNTAFDYGYIDDSQITVDSFNSSININNSMENDSFERQITTWEGDIHSRNYIDTTYDDIVQSIPDDNDFEFIYNVGDDIDNNNYDNSESDERPLLTAWHKYRCGGDVNSKKFTDILIKSREEDLKNNIDPLIEYGYDFYQNPNGSYSMKCNIEQQNTNDVFKTKLDINTRKLFTSHLCNN